MSNRAVAVGQITIDDNCDVITVKNYGASDIVDGRALEIDLTNLDVTTPYLAVKEITGATAARCGIAHGVIPAGGTGQMVVGQITRAYADSAAFTAGNRVLGAAGGKVAEGTTAGQIIGFVVKSETTTTPLIFVAFS